MAILGLVFLLPILLTAAFMFGIAPFGGLALLILAVPRWRRSRGGWRFVKIYCGGVALFVVGCLPIAAMIAAQDFAAFANHLTYYSLHAPRRLDHITFPANSDIQLSPLPPHHLVKGNLGAPTTMFGLRLVNDFAMNEDSSMPRNTVQFGHLVEPHDIDVLPCDVGPFNHNSAIVSCKPVRDVRISGVLLTAGMDAEVKSSENHHAGPDIKATLADAAHLGRFDCAPGPFTLTRTGASCLLAADQDIDGYVLRGGMRAASDKLDGVDSLFDGTLARPLDVDGVVLPAGTTIQRLPLVRAEAMRNHVFTDGENAWFTVAGDVAITLHGGQVVGPMTITFRPGGLFVQQPGG